MPGVTSKEVFVIPKPSFLCSNLSKEATLEYEQSLIRVVFTLLVVIYFLVHGMTDDNEGSFTTAFYLALGYEFFSFIILASFTIYRKESWVRKIITMIGDHGMTCLAMYRAGDVGAPLFTVLLWITVGYGARYGTRYLYLGMLLSSTGLFILINTTDFWIENPVVGYGMIVTNIIIPIFVSKILNQLVHAKAVVEEADRAKGRFLANMSHEMRTPLSGIIGIANLLQKENLSSNIRSHVQTIDASANHLLALIDDILNFSRIESGTLHLDYGVIDIYDVAYSVVDNLKPIADDKNISLHLFISSDVPYKLIGDGGRIRQILLNLCGNAIKFTNDGYVELKINMLNINGDKINLRFEIVDTGIGIPEQAISNIFERFNQADDSITRKYGGTGLGTTISKDLVELMDGEIHVQSTVGKGSRFYFDIPFDISDSEEITSYDGIQCVCYSTDSWLQDRIAAYTRRWNIKNTSVQSTVDISKQLIKNKSSNYGLPLLIIDYQSVNGNINELVKFVNYGLSEELQIILIDQARMTDMEISSKLFISIVYDLSSPRQLYNSIHSAYTDHVTHHNVLDLSGIALDELNNLKVLIVDDSNVNLQILEQVLVKNGVEVVTANDGDVALDYLGQCKFDLAIVDMQMPKIGGLDVIHEYNMTYGINRKIPFIVLTANITQDAKLQCEKVGVASYMKKPVDEALLIKEIHRCTQNDQNNQYAMSSDNASRTERPESEKAKSEEILEISSIHSLMRLSNKEGFFEELVKTFIHDTENSIGIIRNTITNNDYQSFIDETHKLKGSAKNMGSKLLFKVANEANKFTLEEFSKNGISVHSQLKKAKNKTENELNIIVNNENNFCDQINNHH